MPTTHQSHGARVDDAQVRLTTTVAQLDCERRIRHREIAESLHSSQARMSRLVKRAHTKSIVRTAVMPSPGSARTSRTRSRNVSASSTPSWSTLTDRDQDITGGIASAAGRYLEEMLIHDKRIGISSWSETLMATAARMRPLRHVAAHNVIQLVDGLGAFRIHDRALRLALRPSRPDRSSARPPAGAGLVGGSTTRDNLMTDPTVGAVASSGRTSRSPSSASGRHTRPRYWPRAARRSTSRNRPDFWPRAPSGMRLLSIRRERPLRSRRPTRPRCRYRRRHPKAVPRRGQCGR